MKKRWSKTIFVLSLIVMILFISSCRAKYADDSEIKKYAENLVKGENIECMGETEKHRFQFTSKDRNLTFEVWSSAGTVNIDGANFGYTGDYHMHSDYRENVNLYYEAKVYELLEHYGFNDYRKSEEYYSLRHLKFSLPEVMSVKQKENFDEFLAELKKIVIEEREKHTEDIYDEYTTMYTIEVWYKTPQGDYLRTLGLNDSDYCTDILPDDTVYRLEDIQKSNMVVQNIITPLRDGILVEVQQTKV